MESTKYKFKNSKERKSRVNQLRRLIEDQRKIIDNLEHVRDNQEINKELTSLLTFHITGKGTKAVRVKRKWIVDSLNNQIDSEVIKLSSYQTELDIINYNYNY